MHLTVVQAGAQLTISGSISILAETSALEAVTATVNDTGLVAAAGIAAEKDAPLWRSMPRAGGMGARRMSRVDVFRMIKRRVKTVGLGEANCHTFRATGITAYLLNGGTLERAQAIAAHESPRTTKLYDRTADEVTIEDIEKIGI